MSLVGLRRDISPDLIETYKIVNRKYDIINNSGLISY